MRRAGASLHRHGVSAGDVVAIMLPNTAAFVVSLFAAWRLGAAVTPINPSLRPAEVSYQLADADAKVLIVDTVPRLRHWRAAGGHGERLDGDARRRAAATRRTSARTRWRC